MLSVIIPAYNEELLIEKAYLTISEILNNAVIENEIIFIDDGSSDATYENIKALANKENNVLGLHFSRNFGKEAAISAGLASATGDCVVVIDCDLQHPPEKIVEMYRLWQDGFEIVEGIKSGITEMWETFTGWVSEKFEGLKTAVKDLFDINSPSRWAKDEIMGNVMLGFGLGIEENEDEVRKQMDEFTATLTDDVEYDLNARNITARIIAAEPPAEILAATYSKTGPSGSDDKFDRMLALLEIIALNSKKDIVLDKKTLVGELAPEMNEELGAIYALAERGD